MLVELFKPEKPYYLCPLKKKKVKSLIDAMWSQVYDKNTSMKVVGDRADAGECEDGHMERAFWSIVKLCVHPGSSACRPARVPFISPAPWCLSVLYELVKCWACFKHCKADTSCLLPVWELKSELQYLEVFFSPFVLKFFSFCLLYVCLRNMS